jgi:WD40 repeat protein
MVLVAIGIETRVIIYDIDHGDFARSTAKPKWALEVPYGSYSHHPCRFCQFDDSGDKLATVVHSTILVWNLRALVEEPVESDTDDEENGDDSSTDTSAVDIELVEKPHIVFTEKHTGAGIDGVQSMSFAGAGDRVLTFANGQLCVWDVLSRECLATISCHLKASCISYIDAQDRTFIFASDRRMCCHSIDTGEFSWELDVGFETGCIACDPERRSVVLFNFSQPSFVEFDTTIKEFGEQTVYDNLCVYAHYVDRESVLIHNIDLTTVLQKLNSEDSWLLREDSEYLKIGAYCNHGWDGRWYMIGSNGTTAEIVDVDRDELVFSWTPTYRLSGISSVSCHVEMLVLL